MLFLSAALTRFSSAVMMVMQADTPLFWSTYSLLRASMAMASTSSSAIPPSLNQSFLIRVGSGFLSGDASAGLEIFWIVGRDLTLNTVFQRGDDGTSVGIVFRVGGEHESDVERHAHRKPRIWISPSCSILNRATCILAWRSGSSLITKMHRCDLGIRPKWDDPFI